MNHVAVIGIHARRTDMSDVIIQHGNGRPVSKDYFLKGMKLFTERFPKQKCAFLFASDDLKWCKTHFAHMEDVFFSKFKDPSQDMAMLRSTDHFLGR